MEKNGGRDGARELSADQRALEPASQMCRRVRGA